MSFSFPPHAKVTKQNPTLKTKTKPYLSLLLHFKTLQLFVVSSNVWKPWFVFKNSLLPCWFLFFCFVGHLYGLTIIKPQSQGQRPWNTEQHFFPQTRDFLIKSSNFVMLWELGSVLCERGNQKMWGGMGFVNEREGAQMGEAQRVEVAVAHRRLVN